MQIFDITASLLQFFRTAAVEGPIPNHAMRSPSADFEHAAAASQTFLAGCDCIVTRDPKDFRGSATPVVTAGAFLGPVKLA